MFDDALEDGLELEDDFVVRLMDVVSPTAPTMRRFDIRTTMQLIEFLESLAPAPRRICVMDLVYDVEADIMNMRVSGKSPRTLLWEPGLKKAVREKKRPTSLLETLPTDDPLETHAPKASKIRQEAAKSKSKPKREKRAKAKAAPDHGSDLVGLDGADEVEHGLADLEEEIDGVGAEDQVGEEDEHAAGLVHGMDRDGDALELFYPSQSSSGDSDISIGPETRPRDSGSSTQHSGVGDGVAADPVDEV